MKTINQMIRSMATQFVLLSCLLFSCSQALAQVTGDKYPNTGGYLSDMNISYSLISNSGSYDGYPASRVNDDDQSKIWYSNEFDDVDEIYLELDLNQNHPSISQISINFQSVNDNGNGICKKIRVQSKSSNFDWYTTHQDFSFNTIANGVQYFNLSTPITERYIRIVFLEPYRNNFRIRVSEVDLNGGTVVQYAGQKIRHKHAKWHDLRAGSANSGDTFSEDQKMWPWDLTTGYEDPTGGTGIQASHVYIDTIYVHRGTTVHLTLPARNGDSQTNTSYQRWYNFRTDGLYQLESPGNSGVVDLLTPVEGSGVRMQNGYVGQPLTNSALYSVDFYVPTETQWTEWFPNDEKGKDWYIVACDVSDYKDFTETFDRVTSQQSKFSDGWWEPTLAQRVLFFIQPVDNHVSTEIWDNGHKRLLLSEYQNGGEEDGRKYLEEYEISYPAIRTATFTDELVTLNKDAGSYAIPNANKTSDEAASLNVVLAENSAGISLTDESKKISGSRRAIQFTYPNTDNTYGFKSVPSGSTATILVTKTVDGKTYNIARYRLKFHLENSLMTESMLAQLEDENFVWGEQPWKELTYRTRSYLTNHYKLLTQLNWDYDPAVSNDYGDANVYQFPMAWGYSSYGFFDGGSSDRVKTNDFPEWGNYGIINTFPADEDKAEGPAHLLVNKINGMNSTSSFHMYIDASDRPGVLAQLPFREKLCTGSELFVTAWVKAGLFGDIGISPDDDGRVSNDAGMLFTVYGVLVDPTTGKEKLFPLHRHATGQIGPTVLMNSAMPGCGVSGGVRHNEWMQTYFSFINEQNVDYDHYLLGIENYCASTSGGDMYLDNIRVYLTTPSAEITQMETTCVDEITRMNMNIDWERILSRTGHTEASTEAEGEWDAVSFCFIDELALNKLTAADPTILTEKDPTTGRRLKLEDALTKCLVTQRPKDPTIEYKIGILFYNTFFNKMRSYAYGNSLPDGALALNNVVSGDLGAPVPVGHDRSLGFYGKTNDVNGLKSLSVDFYSMLQPNRPYLLLIRTDQHTKAPTIQSFAENFGEECAIQTRFYVTSDFLLKMNGEIVDPSTDYCAGKVFDFTATLRVPYTDSEGKEQFVTVEEGVFFDWFFGSSEEFMDKTADVTVDEALRHFRALYPTATTLNSDQVTTTPTEGEDGELHTFEQKYFDLLEPLYKAGKLILYKDKMDIDLTAGQLDLVLKPIQRKLPPDGTITSEQWALVCWGYIPVHLRLSGQSPQVNTGINSIKYPTDFENANIRVGLADLEAMGTGEGESLNIRLRNAQFSIENPGESARLVKVSSLAGYDKIYLSDSNDPKMKAFLNNPEHQLFDLPIGTVENLIAAPYEAAGIYNQYAEVKFDMETTLTGGIVDGFKFTPREGYFYTFILYYEESIEGRPNNTCIGHIPVTLYVVPEYMEWVGTETGNFNDDSNWRRITNPARLQKSDNTFLKGNDNTIGYCPMMFSKVVIPENKKVELYKCGFESGGAEWVSHQATEAPHIDPITNLIQYDLCVYKHPENDNSSGFPGKYATERFRANFTGEIIFEPGAMMRRAERLVYDKAWVDRRMKYDKWYILTSPFEGTVAGDFYTDSSTGKDKQEYFTEITYNSTANNRYAPAIYQRDWAPAGSHEIKVDGTTADYAISGHWGSLFNEVNQPYEAGVAFSVQVKKQDNLNLPNEGVIIRLPKADTKYNYYDREGNIQSTVADVSSLRPADAHKLALNLLCLRKSDFDQTVDDSKPFVAQLPPRTDDNPYYLIGNPFLCYMDMVQFLTDNAAVIEPMYWTVDETGTMQKVTVSTEDGTITSNPSDRYMPPLLGFFVQKKENQSVNQVEFKIDQQAHYADVTSAIALSLAPQRVSPKTVAITLTDTEQHQHTALVAFREGTTAGYLASEDAMLLADENLTSAMPMIYTAAGGRALSVNQTTGRELIPIGYFAEQKGNATLSFNLAEGQEAQLYDAVTKQFTPITEGLEIPISTAEVGRYFIASSDYEANLDSAVDGDAVKVWAVGSEIQIASANRALSAVSVFSMDGRRVASVSPNAMTASISVERAQSYLVKVSYQSGGEATVKILVK